MKARRGRGEGSVFRRTDGLWCAVLTAGYDANGKRRRRYIYGATKAAVLEQLAHQRHQAMTGTLPDAGRLTVGDYLAHWLRTARSGVRASTAAIYELALRRHIVPIIGGLRLERLTPQHVQGLLADLEARGVGAPMRLKAYNTLHKALQQAVAWQLIPRNSADAAVRPKVPRKEMQALEPEQARRFLEAARADRLHALYAVLVGCGLRLGEALGLTWPDVNLEAGTLTVRRQLSEVGGRIFLQEPKTTTARRTVSLPGFAVEALREHHARMQAEGHLLNDLLLVFVDTTGRPLRRSNIRRRSFEPLLRQAGIPHIRLHDLRHSAATLHLRQGTPAKVVQEMLGHSSIGLTLDLYSHVLPGMQKEAAEKLDALLRPSS